MTGFQFVTFDDPAAVYANPYVNRGFTAAGIQWAFSDIQLYYWQPLTYLSHMLGCQFFGFNAGGHHLINLVIHAASTVLLCLFLVHITGSLWRSCAAAVLFGIHPLGVESVAWITERNTLLCALFWILTLWAYARYVEHPGTRKYLLMLAAFILAVMSKPLAVTLPGVLLLLDWWPLRRLHAGSLFYRIREKVPLLIISAMAAAVTLIGNSEHLVTTSTLPVQVRLSSALAGYSTYLLKLFWPHPLAVFYQYSVPAVEHTTAAIFALSLLTLAAVSLSKRFPYLLWGWLWYLIVLLPVSGIFQVGGQAVADRFTYLPLIGLYVAFVWVAAECIQRLHISRTAVIAVSLVAVGLLGGKSWLQTETWRDSVSLYLQAIKATGGSEPMHRNLAQELASQGRIDEAIEHYREAVRLDPGRAGLRYAMAQLLASQGRNSEAIGQLSEELRIGPDFVPALKELGFLRMRQGELAEAAVAFRHVLRIQPNDPDISSLLPLLASIPDKPEPSPPAAKISVENNLMGPEQLTGAVLLTPAVKWNIGMVLVCIALGFLIPKLGRGCFQWLERSWLRLSMRTGWSLLLVAILPMVVRLAMLPIHPIPQPKIQDEFGYLLIADTFANGRLTNPTPVMWPHFVTHYIFFQPSYTAKYPVGEPMFMAAAQIFGLPPWFGVWLGVGLMCSALYWMLGGWLPPRWALLGALIAAFRFSITSYWMNSYWGGAIAALGGALVLGALPRITRYARVRDSILLSAGLLLLADTRPYEGFLLSIPVAVMMIVWLIRSKTVPLSVRLGRVVLPVAAVLAMGGAFTLYYNWRVTGNAFLMPYKLNQKIYGTPTPFYFEPPLQEPPAAAQYKDLHDNFLWQRQNYMMRWPLSRLANVTGGKLNVLWEFYFQPAMTLPLLFLPLIWRKRKMRPLLLAAIFVLAGIGLYPFFFPHYAAPVFAVFLLIVVQGLRYLRLFEWNGRPVGIFVFRAIVLLLLCTTASELLSPWIGQRKTVRSEALRQFEAAGGKHLVLVRYKPNHSFHFGWIYNDADIDASPVVWARDLGGDSNAELVRYYAGRNVWLLEVDEYPARLSRYGSTEVKKAGS